MIPQWLRNWMKGATEAEARRQIASARFNIKRAQAELRLWLKAYQERFGK